MTESSARLRAGRPRRRLELVAEAPTLPYDAPPDGARTGAGSGSEDPGSQGSGAHGGAAVAVLDGTGELGDLLEQAHELTDRLRAIAPERIHPEGLADALSGLRRVRNRIEAVETSWLSQVRRRKVHRDDGASSAAKWAADQLGGSQRDATNQLRTADQIAELPETAGAFADGDITRESASAIGRVLRDARLRKMEDAERRLLEAAREGGPDQVRRTARALKAAADAETVEDDARHKRAQRYAHVWVRQDGMVKLDALLDQDNGEAFYTAYQALFNASFKDDRERRGETSPDGGTSAEERTGRQRGADILGEMARRLLAVGDIPDAAGRPATVLVTIPETSLRGRLDDGAPAMRFTGPIPISTARRKACDAGIVPVVLNGRSVPVDIGRATRQPTAAQRRCLLIRDGARCRMCGRGDRLLIPHHCVHWADGGPTDLDNLVLVCWACHQLVHEGKWAARWHPDNTVTFTHPDGRRLVRPPPT
ncbi:MAG: DUF222 domain-containing protein [Actinobacteria bacterium]|nr:DUF222 domain-containing protein [Actinomycetota bacterium]